MGVQLRTAVRLLVGPSKVAGWGAFAPHAIGKGDYLIEYLGELVSHEEADRRGQVYDRRASSYLFNLNDKQVVDAGRMGNRSRFANHHDQPNLHTRIFTVRGDHHIKMYASRAIKAGEEVTFDYRYDQSEREAHGFQADGPPADGPRTTDQPRSRRRAREEPARRDARRDARREPAGREPAGRGRDEPGGQPHGKRRRTR